MALPDIDMNADLGEGDPYDMELLTIVSSCNVACGGHAGDESSMIATVAAAIANGVVIGAHPAYPDRDGFGRRSGFQSGDALLESLLTQIRSLDAIVTRLGAKLTHVKPHGALYNDAVNDRGLADTIAAAMLASGPQLMLVGLADSELQHAAKRHGLGFITEGFVDRAYQENGQLLPRSEPGAVHKSLNLVLPQAMALVGKVDTLCIHGDTPGAAEVARAVRTRLEEQGVTIRALSR